MPGHCWQSVEHRTNATWLAKWNEELTGSKMVFLNAASTFKGQSDRDKFEKARKLKSMIKKVRKQYVKELFSSDSLTWQVRLQEACL